MPPGRGDAHQVGHDLLWCHAARLAVAWQGRIDLPQLTTELTGVAPLSTAPWVFSQCFPILSPLASSTDPSCPIPVSQTWAPAPHAGSALQSSPAFPKMHTQSISPR